MEPKPRPTFLKVSEDQDETNTALPTSLTNSINTQIQQLNDHMLKLEQGGKKIGQVSSPRSNSDDRDHDQDLDSTLQTTVIAEEAINLSIKANVQSKDSGVFDPAVVSLSNSQSSNTQKQLASNFSKDDLKSIISVGTSHTGISLPTTIISSANTTSIMRRQESAKASNEAAVTVEKTERSRNISSASLDTTCTTSTRKEKSKKHKKSSKSHKKSKRKDRELTIQEQQTLQSYDSSTYSQVKVTLHKGPNGYGLSIKGGNDQNHLDLNDTGIFISKIKKDGSARKSGELAKGDKIISVNGNSCENITHEMALEYFMKAENKVELVILPRAEAFLRQRKLQGEEDMKKKLKYDLKTWTGRKNIFYLLFKTGFFSVSIYYFLKKIKIINGRGKFLMPVREVPKSFVLNSKELVREGFSSFVSKFRRF